MIEQMDLTNCCRLIENLVREANDNCEAVEALFRLFLSCQKSKFAIKFPGSEIPKWFTCQMDFQGLRRFEFFIEILPNFKWENTGLALCVLTPQSDYSMSSKFEIFIYINEVKVLHRRLYVDSISDHVVLHYIPFLDMWRLHNVAPFVCRVIIFNCIRWAINEKLLKSCGIHLVMPPNEGVCMKLLRAENITSDHPMTS
ncbi:hypothetical protein M0R45_008683 [Rubus argutus]|uniref:Uncharacterized protein n=1 Tax=Rubus argutus TaxID=59490 RepID=A0AAW1Y3T0_RUBAR